MHETIGSGPCGVVLHACARHNWRAGNSPARLRCGSVSAAQRVPRVPYICSSVWGQAVINLFSRVFLVPIPAAVADYSMITAYVYTRNVGVAQPPTTVPSHEAPRSYLVLAFRVHVRAYA